MSQHHNGVSLANLPSDVIRKIIGMGLDSFDSIRFITRRWNGLAKERFKCHAKIHYFEFRSDFCEKTWHFCLRMPGHLRGYYGVQCWTLSERVFLGGCEVKNSIFHNRQDKSHEKKMRMWIDKRLKCLIKRCAQIVTFELRKELDDLDMISVALGKVPIVNFVISDLLQIYDKYRALFIDFIKAHSVRYVQLHFDHMDWNTYAGVIKKFFNEAMPLVTSIEFNFREDARNQATLRNEWDARTKELVGKGNYSINVRVTLRSAPVRPSGEYGVFLKIEQL